MRSIVVFFLLTCSVYTFSQTGKNKIYNPQANASEDIEEAVAKAQAENKHVLIQVGGNWCPWCIKLHRYIHEHQQLDSIINADYVFIKVNYSKENKNPKVMQRLEFPQRFGFPVMVVLDGQGNRIHTQETASLEQNSSYGEEKVKRFLLSWNKEAINPANYK